jgi:hypothetical protein
MGPKARRTTDALARPTGRQVTIDIYAQTAKEPKGLEAHPTDPVEMRRSGGRLTGFIPEKDEAGIKQAGFNKLQVQAGRQGGKHRLAAS